MASAALPDDLYYTVGFQFDNGVRISKVVVDKYRRGYQKTETYSSNIATPLDRLDKK